MIQKQCSLRKESNICVSSFFYTVLWCDKPVLSIIHRISILKFSSVYSMVNGTTIFNVLPKALTNFQLSWQLQLKCQRISLPSPSRMQRETCMGPRLKWNILFKWYWSEWHRIKEKEVLNNVRLWCFFFWKLIFQGPPFS